MKRIIFMSLSCALLLSSAKANDAVSFGGHRNASVQSLEQDANLKNGSSENQRAERKSRLSLGSQRATKQDVSSQNESEQDLDSLPINPSVQTSPALNKRRPAPVRTKKTPPPPPPRLDRNSALMASGKTPPPLPPRPDRNSALMTSGQTPPPIPPRPDRNSVTTVGAGSSWKQAGVSKNKWRGMGAHDKVSAGISRFLDPKSSSGLNIKAVTQALAGGGERNDKFLFDIKTYAAMQQNMPSPNQIKQFMTAFNDIHNKLNEIERLGETGTNAAFRKLKDGIVKDLTQVKSGLQNFDGKDVYIQELISQMLDVQSKLSNPNLAYNQLIEQTLKGISHIQAQISGLRAHARKNFPNINKTIARLKQYGLSEIQMDHIPSLNELGVK